jgi:hypothetical protein
MVALLIERHILQGEHEHSSFDVLLLLCSRVLQTANNILVVPILQTCQRNSRSPGHLPVFFDAVARDAEDFVALAVLWLRLPGV